MDSKFKHNKHPFFGDLLLSQSGPLECALEGLSILSNPYFNKGSAFTIKERDEFHLHGLLPVAVQTLDEQVERAYRQLQSRSDPLAKNTFMTSLRMQNEVLFYKLTLTYLKELFPIIYTPTEGDAIANFSGLFRKPEGCFLDIAHQDRIPSALARWGGSPDDIDLIVVSDGEQILGIGDQGVGGVLISVAKLVLYTLCAGINPSRTLPVVLDCGTNNDNLLKDDLYLGTKSNRKQGKEYDDFVEQFIISAKKIYPRAYIHFEDFGFNNARRILDNHSSKIACFNDDIQGTGCVTLAAILSALHVTKTKLQDIKVITFGAGTAGIGIADQIRDAIAVEASKSKEDAAKQIWCVDKVGILTESKKDKLSDAQKEYAQSDDQFKAKSSGNALLDAIKTVKPHVLIGTSTIAGAFTEEIVKEMAKHVERPIIFPLSNPTRLHEAKPEDLIKWTNGKALIATGSPFDPVKYDGKTYTIAECNNSVVFPGIGLGSILCNIKLVPPSILVAATKAVASLSPILQSNSGALLPDVENVRDVSVEIAAAVIQTAIKEGLSQEDDIPQDDSILRDWIREQMWEAEYRPLKKIEFEGAHKEAKGQTGSARTH